MYTSKIFRFVAVILAAFFINSSLAQTNVKRDTILRRKPAFVLQIGGGISTYAKPVNVRRPIDLPGNINKFSGATTARLMWYPKYRLRVGVETGFLNFYSYKVKNGNTNGSVSLNAIPALVVFSMQLYKRLNVYAGFGSYWLTTHLEYNGTVNSSQWVLGSNIALSYTFPVSTRAGFAAEAKWTNAFETKDAAISLQAHFIWKLFQWD